MPLIAWMVLAGVAMSLIALVGSTTLLMPPEKLDAVLLPLVALAAGSMLGGSLFHLLPESIDNLGNRPSVYGSFVGGFLVFFALEQTLHWHHCHRTEHDHRIEGGHVGHLILLADGLHNAIGGVAVGGAFVVDTRLGLTTWLVAAAHEVPQELGDFGVLINSGWTPRRALAWNLGSASTFLGGMIVAYLLADHVRVAYLLPFAAGNFLYIAATDLLPEVTQEPGIRDKIGNSVSFFVGLMIVASVSLV
jgi:zinc and cadmium transporter